MSARPAERGYALIMAAIAMLFLAVASAAIVHATAGGSVSARYEVDQSAASSVAAAGLEWALTTGGSGQQTFGAGTFNVVLGPGRRIQSTGVYGSATRVAVCETTLFYVPNSRWSTQNENLVFEVVNLTGADVTLSSLVLQMSSAAFYETVSLSLFSDLAGDVPVDYGVIWSYATNNAGVRAGTNQSITIGGSRIIPNGRQALVTFGNFASAAQGGSTLNVDPLEFRVTFKQAAGALAATAVPRVDP